MIEVECTCKVLYWDSGLQKLIHQTDCVCWESVI